MHKFIRKPEIVEAVQLTAENREEICKWLNGGKSGRIDESEHGLELGLNAWYCDYHGDGDLALEAIDGTEPATAGDYIIKYGNGLIDVWEKRQFESLYERVAD